MMLDPRLNAFRADLADITLKDVVAAAAYAEGSAARIAEPVVPLRSQPVAACGIDTQLLLGEDVRVFARENGWAWVKALRDGYVGYMPETALAEPGAPPSHHIVVPRSFVYPAADLRHPAVAAISMGSRIRVVGEAETRDTGYFLLDNGHAVIAAHCLPLGRTATDDFVTVAARFVETPYLWGGRSGFGIDCSGLVQLSLQMAGHTAPRDSDMQAERLGAPIAREALRRGDLVFWKGHVGIMEDADLLLHASGLTMSVTREPLESTIERIAKHFTLPTGYRRPI